MSKLILTKTQFAQVCKQNNKHRYHQQPRGPNRGGSKARKPKTRKEGDKKRDCFWSKRVLP